MRAGIAESGGALKYPIRGTFVRLLRFGYHSNSKDYPRYQD